MYLTKPFGEGTIYVIDTAQKIDTSYIDVDDAPQGVDVNPHTNTIYVANYLSNTTSVINGTTNTVVENIPVGGNPQSVGVNPNTNMVYVANSWTNDVSVINGTTNTAIENITVGVSPLDIAVNPNTNRVYVVNYDSNTTSVINGTTNTVIEDIPVGGNPQSVGVNPNTNMVYVTNYWTNDVSVINGTTNTAIENITVGVSPFDIAVNPNTNMIYTSIDTGIVSFIDGATNTVTDLDVKEVNLCPSHLAINTENEFLYLLNNCSDTITEINEADSSFVDIKYPLIGTSPGGIAYNPQSGRIYISDPESNTVYHTKVGDIRSSGKQTKE